jgi:hypothetical protein
VVNRIIAPGRPTIGVTAIETVMLNLDNMSFRTARYWARRVMKWHKLEGFLLLKSSYANYHAVFNRKVDWSENMQIVAWVSLLSRKSKLQMWHRMQCNMDTQNSADVDRQLSSPNKNERSGLDSINVENLIHVLIVSYFYEK